MKRDRENGFFCNFSSKFLQSSVVSSYEPVTRVYRDCKLKQLEIYSGQRWRKCGCWEKRLRQRKNQKLYCCGSSFMRYLGIGRRRRASGSIGFERKHRRNSRIRVTYSKTDNVHFSVFQYQLGPAFKDDYYCVIFCSRIGKPLGMLRFISAIIRPKYKNFID